jgi:hypothetical protein
MAQPPTRTVTAAGIDLIVVELYDRRQGPANPLLEWLFQSELENYLYSNWQTRGSFFQLLSRAGADGQSICLRRKAVEEGLVTDSEFIAMRNAINPSARVFTLVPFAAIELALTTYGKSPRAGALADALDLDTFSESEEEGEEEEEEQEEEEEEEEQEEEEEEEEEERDGEERGDGEDDGGGGVAGGSAAAGPSSAHGDDPSDDAYAETEEEENAPDVDGVSSSKGNAPRQASYALAEIPPDLNAELNALEQWRVSPINMSRKGVAVAEITAAKQRQNVVRLLGWLVHEKKLARPTLNAFASTQIGAAVQLYIQFLVDEKQRKYSSIAVYLSSFIAAARFVHAQRSKGAAAGATVGEKPVEDLKSMHAQALQMARQETALELTKPPKRSLDWADVQRARCRAEEALAALGDDASPAQRQELTRDVALLMCLTRQAPDRVGVTRLLKLGGTLKRMPAGGFQLDLSAPGDHKTIGAFGASLTTMSASIAAAIKPHLALSIVPDAGYVFAAADNPYEPMQPYQWTRFVQSVFKRYSGVALAPKDLRSAHVTWLKTDEHDDETLRAAAQAMRHSSKTQECVPALEPAA